MTGHRDLPTRLAVAAVVAAAGATSWTNLTHLGEATAYAHLLGLDMAFLLPVAVDGYTALAAVAWLGGRSVATRRWGLVSSLSGLLLSIAGSFGGHAVAAGAWRPSWVASSGVSMTGPLMLFAGVLLWKLLSRDHAAQAEREAAREAKGTRRTPAKPPASVATGQVTQLRRRPTSTGPAAATHAAYERLHAAGRVNGHRSLPTYRTLAAELGVSERTVRRHMTDYQPRQEVASGH